MKKSFRAFMPLALALTLLSCSADESIENVIPEQTNPVQQVSSYTYSSDEMQLANAINQHRQSIGEPALQVVNFVSLKSEEHNAYMIENQVVNHDNFEQRSHEIISALGASQVHENVAYNYSTASAVLNAWLNSPEHRANIEGDFTSFGFSISIDPATGKKYYTNIFIKT